MCRYTICACQSLKSISTQCMQLFAVDCSAATIAGAYSYAVPSPAMQGTVMPVSCPVGHAWSRAPSGRRLTATCTNVRGSGSWVLTDSAVCAGASFLFTSIVIQ